MCQILTVSKYRLIRKIGEGGFGAVWVAKNTQDNSLVALKEILSPNQSGHERKALGRYAKLSYYSESESPAPIEGLIPILEVFVEDGKTYYTMPLCDGTDKGKAPTDSDWEPLTLDALIENRRSSEKWFSAKEIANIIIPLFTAAAKLNDEGFIHRDIKPANILFFNGKPCLADIGLMAEDRLSVSSAGTPDFTAPNWYINGNPDMWGCAATLFKLLTGNPPDLMGRGAYLWQPCGKEKMSFSDVQIWRNMQNAINRATAEKPKDRYLRFSDFIADVRAASEGGKIAQLPVPTKSNGRKVAAAAAVALVAVAGTVAYFASKPSSSGSEQTQNTQVASVEPPAKAEISDIQQTQPAQPKLSFEQSLNGMTREELAALAADLSAKIRQESDNTKAFELFKNLLTVSTKISPSTLGQEIPTLPWVIKNLSGVNPIEILKKSEAAARAINNEEIADKLKASLESFEPQYMQTLSKQEKDAILLDSANKIQNEMQNPKEIADSFDKLATLATGMPAVYKEASKYINAAEKLGRIDGINVVELFKKAEQANRNAQSHNIVDTIKKAREIYESGRYKKMTVDEKNKLVRAIAEKIESGTSPDETVAQFQKMLLIIFGEPFDNLKEHLEFASVQVANKLGTKTGAVLKKAEDAYAAIGDTETAKKLEKIRGRFPNR